MKTMSFERIISATPDVVWEIISDVGNYADIAPNIDTSRLVSGEGIGAIRECSSKEGRWREICSVWETGKRFSFDVQTQADDYPFPFTHLKAWWTVVPISKNSTMIKMDFSLEFSNIFLSIFIFPFIKPKFSRVCQVLLDNWQREIERTG